MDDPILNTSIIPFADGHMDDPILSASIIPFADGHIDDPVLSVLILSLCRWPYQSSIIPFADGHMDDPILSASIIPFADGHMDERDAQWTGDKDLSPLDVNSLDARSFVIYKFGCFIAGVVAARCQHAPVTILLADRIPANPQLTRNLYRNSFHFDANNRILYVRAARLDTVGEFVLVLVHCLAHIKSGEWGVMRVVITVIIRS